MTKAISAFYDYLMPQLPGCTTALVDLELREVLREYCESTRCWRETFPSIEPIAGQVTFPLYPDTNKAIVVGMLSMRSGTQLVWTASPPHEDRGFDDPVVQTPRYPADRPPFSLDPINGEITFDCEPAETITLTGWVTPLETMTGLPDWLITHHLDGIRRGTLSRLMLMQGKPWSNAALASVYQELYQQDLNFEATVASRGNTRAPLRTRKTTI